MNRSLARNRSQRGTALIEFALVLPFIILLTFIVVDLSRAFMIKATVEQSAREGARMLAADTTMSAAEIRVKAVTTAAGIDPKTVTVEFVRGASKGDPITCNVQTSFQWLYPGLFNFLGLLGGNTVTVSGANTCYREY